MLFQRTVMIYSNQNLMNLYLEELVSLSVWPEIAYMAKLTNINFRLIEEDTIPDMEFGTTQYA